MLNRREGGPLRRVRVVSGALRNRCMRMDIWGLQQYNDVSHVSTHFLPSLFVEKGAGFFPSMEYFPKPPGYLV